MADGKEDREESTPDEKAQFDVTRDVNFARFYADKIVPVDLGNDVELAFLQASPGVARFAQEDGGYAAKFQPSYNEAARVRVSMSTLIEISLQTLRIAIERNAIGVDATVELLRDWSESREESD